MNDHIEPIRETEPTIDLACQCPACGNGTMMTILVLDGCGNVVKEICPDADADHILIAGGSP